MTRFDVITLGETMIRLSPPNHQTLEQAASLDVTVGGSESNTAIALSRLGMRTAWISKLVDNPVGRKISSSIASHGVNTSGIVWTTKTRNAVYFIEFGKGLRPHRVTYDRRGSAINTLKPSEINWDLFRGTRVVHLSGITAALSRNCRSLLKETAARARKGRSLVSFDVNYRAKLWSQSLARRHLSPICSDVDILFVNTDDAANVFGVRDKPEGTVEALASRFACSVVVLTMGKEGAICWDDGEIVQSNLYPTVEVDRVGAGDAFSAGFLFGYLTRNVNYALDFAVAMSALKFTIPGDLAFLTKDDVEAVLNSGSRKIQR